MTHPYEEYRDMKLAKRHNDMLGFIADAQYGIPTRCPCGGQIKQDATPNPKYPSDFDTLPGRRYFTYKSYEDDGMHFRQPWVFGVGEEVMRLRDEVDKMGNEISKLRMHLNDLHLNGGSSYHGPRDI